VPSCAQRSPWRPSPPRSATKSALVAGGYGRSVFGLVCLPLVGLVDGWLAGGFSGGFCLGGVG
jgi:hypothetical protein